jgi:hypothetical protein
MRRWLGALAGLLLCSVAHAEIINVTPAGGSGGTTTIVPNSTPCTGCTANGLLYSDGMKVQSLATANNGALVTSAGGVLSISTTLPSGLTIPGYAPLASPTFTGTVTLPDSSTWTSTLLTLAASSGFRQPNGANSEYGGCTWATNIWTCGTTTNAGTARAAALRVNGSGLLINTTGIIASFDTTVTQFNLTAGTGGMSVATGNGKLAFAMAGGGTNYIGYGPTTNDAACLGYSSSYPNGNITCVLTWTDNGTVTIAPNNSITNITGSLTVSALANAATTSAVCYNTGTGVLTYDGTVGTCTVSGRQFKNILGGFDSVANIDSLRPAVYRYKPESGFDDGRVHVGLIAQDVARMDDRCVVRNTDGEIINFEDRCVIAHLITELHDLRRSIAR